MCTRVRNPDTPDGSLATVSAPRDQGLAAMKYSRLAVAR
jgi:hypothetical protein